MLPQFYRKYNYIRSLNWFENAETLAFGWFKESCDLLFGGAFASEKTPGKEEEVWAWAMGTVVISRTLWTSRSRLQYKEKA